MQDRTGYISFLKVCFDKQSVMQYLRFYFQLITQLEKKIAFPAFPNKCMSMKVATIYISYLL